MRFIYSILYTAAFIAALPYWLLTGLLRGKYLRSARQRFGGVPFLSSVPSIWIHAVSVGEFLAAKPVIKALQERYPQTPIFVSTTTITGQLLAAKMFPQNAFYFPFDWAWTVRRILRRIRPQLILIMETELWPNLLWEAERAAIPVVLVNGRLSERSFGRYSRLGRFLPPVDRCLMQNEQDAVRMSMLRMCKHVHVTGNVKFDLALPQLSADLKELLSLWKKGKLLWIAGSTMEGEEEQVLAAFEPLRGQMRLLLAPRHPERFSAVTEIAMRSGFQCVRRTTHSPGDADIVILDTIGELAACYQFADLVFIGGSLVPHGGGHNPIEAAYYAKAILTGPNYRNFQAIYDEFIQNTAALATTDLKTTVAALVTDEATRANLGRNARALVDRNVGATNRSLQFLEEYLRKERIGVEPSISLHVQ